MGMNALHYVNISWCDVFQSLIMNDTRAGVQSPEYVAKIPIYLTAALKLHRKPMTNHELVMATGYHAGTITKYIQALVKSGIVKIVPQITPRYVIAEDGEGKSA